MTLKERPEHNLCGPIIKVRAWRKLAVSELTRGERVMKFIETFCITPEGEYVGKPMRLAKFQEEFICAIYDNPHKTRKAILSIARKNGKSGLIAGILLAHICGPEAKKNSQIVSGALSREQAALVHNLASKMVEQSERLSARVKCIPSTKRLVSASNGTEYKSLAAEGKTAHGLSPLLAILDEMGQVVGPSSAFIEAVTTSQGAHAEPLLIIISTQASSDADYLSLQIDDALQSQDKHTVCHLYQADKDCELLDADQWKKANPALGIFRSRKDLETQLTSASRMPTQESSARNLLLNQRITQKTLWLSPSVWKNNRGEIDESLFEKYPVHIGLDLSMRADLTAAVASVFDVQTELVHLKPFVFVPADGLEEKSRRDRAPYDVWVREGKLIAVPGKTIDYQWVAQFLKQACESMFVASVQFDRWSIEHFRQACLSIGFEVPDWVPVGQGYKDFSPRLKAMETALLQEKIRHGNHPLLNMSVANAIASPDPAGNLKLAKDASTQRIDPLVAAVMAAYPCLDARTNFDVGAFIS